MCCHFQGIPSTWWGTEGTLIYRSFGAPLSVPLHTPLHHWLNQVVTRRSLGHVRVFCYRTIREMHGTRGECSMMVATGADMPLGKSLWWPWRVHSILDWVWWLDGGTQVLSFKPDLISNVVLAWNGSVSFCCFIDGPGGLISVFHQFSDALFRQIIVWGFWCVRS